MTLAAHAHHAADALCSLVWIVVVISTAIALVLGLLALVGRAIAPWLPAAVVALIAWIVLLLLC